MVRTYQSVNRYRIGSKISDDLFLSILRGYISFSNPKETAKLLGLSRQSVGENYLWIGKILYGMNRVLVTPPLTKIYYDDRDYVTYWRRPDDNCRAELLKKLMDRVWVDSYERFSEGASKELYRKYWDAGQSPPDASELWLIGQSLWDNWKGIPKSTFRYHWALIHKTYDIRMFKLGYNRDCFYMNPQQILDPELAEEGNQRLFEEVEELLRKHPKEASSAAKKVDTLEFYEAMPEPDEIHINIYDNIELFKEYMQVRDNRRKKAWEDSLRFK